MQPSIHDPISFVPLSLVPVDPGDIHIEVTDNVSLESSSSRSSTHGFSCEDLQGHHRAGALYCDSAETEQERGLDSGISIPHSSEETCGTNGD